MDLNIDELILKINSSNNYIDIFYDINNWKKEYKSILMLIHPDRCHFVGAKEATEKLIKIADEMENGKKIKDDSGDVSLFINHIIINGDKTFLKKSYDNYLKLMSHKDPFFSKYLPTEMLLSNDSLKVSSEKRFIPLSLCGTLPQEHLNWVLNRVLEFCTWLNSIGYSHNGINPESIVTG